VSEHFERWKQLAALCLREQDPEKLTEFATEMNRALLQKTSHSIGTLSRTDFSPSEAAVELAGFKRSILLVDGLRRPPDRSSLIANHPSVKSI
jgi:hypothetical protein